MPEAFENGFQCVKAEHVVIVLDKSHISRSHTLNNHVKASGDVVYYTFNHFDHNCKATFEKRSLVAASARNFQRSF